MKQHKTIMSTRDQDSDFDLQINDFCREVSEKGGYILDVTRRCSDDQQTFTAFILYDKKES